MVRTISCWIGNNWILDSSLLSTTKEGAERATEPEITKNKNTIKKCFKLIKCMKIFHQQNELLVKELGFNLTSIKRSLTSIL